jgi:23S rRNA (cytosine1962-C5)-methyltransferase
LSAPAATDDALARAIERRRGALAAWDAEGTDCVRLLHGTTEGAPGIAIDRYGPLLLVQTWREPLPAGVLDTIAERASRELGTALAPVWNHRGSERREGLIGSEASPALDGAIGHELGARFAVRPRHRGQDPLLFLDLRAGRRWVRAHARDRSVLNLFAYTCGIGVAAALGGAREVWNVDFARSSLEVGRENAALNGIDDARFRMIEEDVIPVVRQLAGLGLRGRGARPAFVRREARTFDLVVLDPPRWARGAFGAVDVIRDYASLFKPAVLACAPGGTVLATNHVPSVEEDEWVRGLRRCAEKAGRGVRAIEMLRPEADFPSPDDRPPLKIALVETA